MSEQEIKQSLEREREALLKARDELRLQLHLGSLEAKQLWDELERKWEQVSEELGKVGLHAKEPLNDIGKATRALLGEIKNGYDRVRGQLK